MFEIPKNAMIGELYAKYLLTTEERGMAIQRERDNAIKHMRQAPDPNEQAITAFAKICNEDKAYSKTLPEIAQESGLDPDKALPKGPRIKIAIEELIKEGVIKNIDSKKFAELSELMNAVQAIGRGEAILEVFEKGQLQPDRLKNTVESFGYPEIKLENLPEEKWINDAQGVTRKAQAVTSMLKCFVTALITNKDPQIYDRKEVKEAIGAIEPLLYLLQKETIKELRQKNGPEAVINQLREEIKDKRFPEIETKYLSALTRGIAFVLEKLGLSGWADKVSAFGEKGDTKSFVTRIVEGTKTAPAQGNSDEPIWTEGAKQWLDNRATQAGLEPQPSKGR